MHSLKLFVYYHLGNILRFIINQRSRLTSLNSNVKYSYALNKVFVFWTGDNEITENRKRCLQVLQEKSGVEVKLVKAAELKQYEHSDYPFHSAYQYLSLNHRSDYLRCYFMHVYGGAYSDIKENLHSWAECFDRLNSSDKWILGYSEIAPSGVASQDKVLRINYFRLIGNGCFICKPQTPLTTEWFGIVNDLLDKNFEKLKENPGDMWGKNDGYPLRWAEVQGELFHPLIYKYRNKVLHDERMILSFKNYK